MSTRNRLRLRPTLLPVALVMAVTACPPKPYGPPERLPTIPAPFDSSHVDTVSVATMKAYGNSLHFDTVLGAADQQPLLVKGGRRYGFARIEPEVGAYQLDTLSLATGRIVARISSESTYTELGLGRGMSWWWVDKRGGKWRSIVYSEALNAKTAQILESLGHHPSHRWWQSVSRFALSDQSAVAWTVCGMECCPVGPTALIATLLR